MVIIDAWMQHPSAEFLADPVFDSLRRWARGRLAGGEVPVAATVAAADCLRDLASLQLDEETAEAFLHATAERVFGLAAGPGPASPATTERAQA